MFASLKLPLATAEATRRQHVASTFTEPLDVAPSRRDELREFLADFYKTIYHKRNELSQLLQDNAALSQQYQTLVETNKQVSYEDFWQRYFWKCDAHRILVEWHAKDVERAQARSEYIAGGLARVQKFVKDSTTSTSATVDENEHDSGRESHPLAKEEDAVDDFLKNHEIIKDGVDDYISRSPNEREEAVVFWNREEEATRKETTPLSKPPRSPASKKPKQQRAPFQDNADSSKKNKNKNVEPEESGEIPLVSKAASKQANNDDGTSDKEVTKQSAAVNEVSHKTSENAVPPEIKEMPQRRYGTTNVENKWKDVQAPTKSLVVESKTSTPPPGVTERSTSAPTTTTTTTTTKDKASVFSGQGETYSNEPTTKNAKGKEATTRDAKDTTKPIVADKEQMAASKAPVRQLYDASNIPSTSIERMNLGAETESVVVASSVPSKETTAIPKTAKESTTTERWKDAETKTFATDEKNRSTVPVAQAPPTGETKPAMIPKEQSSPSTRRETPTRVIARDSKSIVDAGRVSSPPTKEAKLLSPPKGNKVNRFRSYFENASSDAKKRNRSMGTPGEKPPDLDKPRAAPVLRSWKHKDSVSHETSTISKARENKINERSSLSKAAATDTQQRTDAGGEAATKEEAAKRGPIDRIVRGWSKSKRDENRELCETNDGNTNQVEVSQSPRSVLYAASPKEPVPPSAEESIVDLIDSATTKKTETLKIKTNMMWWTIPIGFVLLAIAVVVSLSSSPILNGLCAPALPGTRLSAGPDKDDVYLEAPWWAPMPYKSRAFTLVCGNDRTRAAVDWIPFDRKKDFYRLTLRALSEGESLTVIHRGRRRLSSVVMLPRKILAIDLQGKEEDIPAPWAMDVE